MIIITGATGKLGSQIVECLLERASADELAVSVRDPEKAAPFARRGVRVRRGDFAEPASLADAFEGASQVLVVSVDKVGEEAIAQSTAAIDAAYRAGADRVLYTSHQAANPDSFFAPARDHAAVEAHLQQRGQPYTALRNGYYSTTSLRFQIGNAAQTGKLLAPADGQVSWTAPADLAEAAAAVLAGEFGFDGPTPPLTAANAINLREVAAILSDVSGRTVERVIVDDGEFVQRLIERGTPEPLARLFLGSFLASRNGEFAVTDATLERLIGHPPTTIRDVLTTADRVE